LNSIFGLPVRLPAEFEFAIARLDAATRDTLRAFRPPAKASFDLSLRARAGIIFGLALVTWLMVIAVGYVVSALLD
jgi:hypothetical protein